MATEGSTTPANASGDDLFRQVEDYAWTEDADFQGGLSAILGSNATQERTQELTLRARKHGITVDFDGYKAWRVNHASDQSPASKASAEPPASQVPQNRDAQPIAGSATSSTGAKADAPYPTSFDHIVELITKGEPIPGIKDIPDTVLEGKESRSTTARRKKPWETNADSSDAPATTV